MTIEWTKPTYFNIKWDDGPNQPASPLTEITRDEFLGLFHCGPWMVDGINYGGHAPLPDSNASEGMYAWHYYFFHRHALAVAERYTHKLPENQEHFIAKGASATDGYHIRFYRLGCQHPRITSEWLRMHDRQDKCPDCGFSAMYDTSD